MTRQQGQDCKTLPNDLCRVDVVDGLDASYGVRPWPKLAWSSVLNYRDSVIVPSPKSWHRGSFPSPARPACLTLINMKQGGAAQTSKAIRVRYGMNLEEVSLRMDASCMESHRVLSRILLKTACRPVKHDMVQTCFANATSGSLRCRQLGVRCRIAGSWAEEYVEWATVC